MKHKVNTRYGDPIVLTWDTVLTQAFQPMTAQFSTESCAAIGWKFVWLLSDIWQYVWLMSITANIYIYIYVYNPYQYNLYLNEWLMTASQLK